MFFPLVITTIIAVIIEQILRRVGNPEWHADSVMIRRAMEYVSSSIDKHS